MRAEQRDASPRESSDVEEVQGEGRNGGGGGWIAEMKRWRESLIAACASLCVRVHLLLAIRCKCITWCVCLQGGGGGVITGPSSPPKHAAS